MLYSDVVYFAYDLALRIGISAFNYKYLDTRCRLWSARRSISHYVAMIFASLNCNRPLAETKDVSRRRRESRRSNLQTDRSNITDIFVPTLKGGVNNYTKP